MSISVTCDECFRDYEVPERFAGRKVKCKSCGATMTVPDGLKVVSDEEESGLGYGSDYAAAGSLPPGRLRKTPATVKTPAEKAPAESIFRSVGFWIAAVAGSVMIGMVACCGGGVLWVRQSIDAGPVEIYAGQPPHGDPSALFPVSQIPVPQFPDLGDAKSVGSEPVQLYHVDLGTIPANDGAAGMQMTMQVYLPPGAHVPGSLPCVLVAPAGTNLLHGSSLDPGSGYHDETLPYAEAGMVVVQYSLDGDEFDAGESDAYLQFRAAGAGVVNTRNALEFTLAKLPMVDPARIYTAGHSSAGTLALLAAAHEPRLAGAIAYMPATDVEERLGDLVDVPLISAAFPEIEEFITQSSPRTHIATIDCPVFLFHSRDDSNVPFSQSEQFAELLQANGTDVTFQSVASGDHYSPMLSDGIPRAIEWLAE